MLNVTYSLHNIHIKFCMHFSNIPKSINAKLFSFIFTSVVVVVIKAGKAIPLQAWAGPEGSRMLRLSDFKTIDI